MKSWKKFFNHLTSPFMVGLVVTGLVTYISLVYYATRSELAGKSQSIAGRIQEIHEKTIDWRLRDRGPIKGAPEVAILAIDDRSIAEEGRWPWPRDKQAKLIDRTMTYGAKSISFDITYAEPDANSALPSLTKLTATSQKENVSPGMSTALAEELEKSDLDRYFANSIALYQDHLILGSFYLEDISNSSPQADICLDHAFNRSYAGRYWKKDTTPVTVVDVPANENPTPAFFKTGLERYFTALESNEMEGWFNLNPDAAKRIEASLQDMAKDFDPAMYAGLSVLVLNNELERAQELLQQVNPAFADAAHVKTFFQRFAGGLRYNEITKLDTKLRETDVAYCNRFLTDADDLLNVESHKKIWGDTPEAVEQFKELSWESTYAQEKAEKPADGREPASVAAVIDKLKATSLKNSVFAGWNWIVNIPILADATLHSGYFTATQDTDGSIRRARLISRTGNHYFASTALKTFMINKKASLQAKIDREDVGRQGAKSKILKSFEILNSDGNTELSVPVDRYGYTLINYSGPGRMFPHVSAGDLLNDAPMMEIEVREYDETTKRWVTIVRPVNKREFMKDKVLILGATAMGVFDLRVTPFDENFPGVETHANVLSNLLIEQGRAKGEDIPPNAPGFLRTHPQEERVMWVALVALGVLLTAFLSYFGSVAGLGITGLFLVAVYAIDKYYFFKSGYVITVLFPISLVSLDYVTLTFYKYFTEERKKQALKGTFQKYVSPAVVNEILANPENIELGGKKMELTVLFSDIRGFTTFSEKLDPSALSDFLNSYLTPMTDIVFETKGTLDKYMGDAIMAFWGAPIHFDDHAKHAARCALKMLEKLKDLEKIYKEQNLPPIDIGIGLNSGEMSVGNMGSNTVRSYTVMGDAVNLGSRLEGINKKYGTRIIVSEFTYAAIKDSFVCREVDWVRVKGKVKPVKIFELIAEKTAPEPMASLLPHYNEAYRLYHEMKFDEAKELFQKALEAHPADELSGNYVELCDGYLAEPPPADWDGVSNMKEK